MSLSETRVDSLAIAIVDSNSWERIAYYLPLIRLLSRGYPVTTEQLATVLGRPEASVAEVLRQFEDVVYDAERQAAAPWLSQTPSAHLLPIEEAFTLGQKLARLTMQRLQDGERGVCARHCSPDGEGQPGQAA